MAVPARQVSFTFKDPKKTKAVLTLALAPSVLAADIVDVSQDLRLALQATTGCAITKVQMTQVIYHNEAMTPPDDGADNEEKALLVFINGDQLKTLLTLPGALTSIYAADAKTVDTENEDVDALLTLLLDGTWVEGRGAALSAFEEGHKVFRSRES